MPESVVSAFMWMHEVELSSGDRLHAYKHFATRRYLHLGTEGGAYLYLGEASYGRVALAYALDLAMRPWWERLGASIEETTAAWAAIATAGGGK